MPRRGRPYIGRAEAEAESILEQETLLGIPLTDNLTALSNLRETLEPMARLWTTAKEYLDGHHAWLESPLRTVNAEEAERKVGPFYFTETLRRL